MSIVSLDDCLIFLGITPSYFVVTPGNNKLTFTSSSGGPVTIELTSASYDGAALATQIQTKMNANTTLTGTGTITFTVSYSSSTRLFTINAGTGKTISYDHDNSDAGLIIGFTADKAAAQTNVSDTLTGDPTQLVSILHDEVEEFVSSYCRRAFDGTSYRLERYDGNGGNILSLLNYPITAVDRVAIGTLNVMQIRNTNQYSTATVSVTTTGLRLVLDGTADTSITFASNTTMTAVVNAISALGSGWEARISSSIYSNFKSTELIPCYGLSSIDGYWVDLYKTDDPLSDFHVYLDRGQIKRYSGFPSGEQNIFIDYTAGFTSANMPSDLQLAVKIIVQYLYNKNQESSFGLTQYRIGYNSVLSIFEEGSIPKEAERILFRHSRKKV